MWWQVQRVAQNRRRPMPQHNVWCMVLERGGRLGRRVVVRRRVLVLGQRVVCVRPLLCGGCGCCVSGGGGKRRGETGVPRGLEEVVEGHM